MTSLPFSKEVYRSTGGWVPMNPLTQDISLGDYCKLNTGTLKTLGNIADLDLVNEVLAAEGLALNPGDWKLQNGVKQVYCETLQMDTDTAEQYITKQALEFSDAGSILFYGHNPICDLIVNWSEFVDDITLKLSQSSYSFRHVYVITGLATIKNWSITIAGTAGAQLETSSEIADTDIFNLLSHASSRAEKQAGIEIFDQSKQRDAYFFKAKKMILSDEKREFYLKRIIASGTQGRNDILPRLLDDDLFDQIRAGELNIGNCLEFFSWSDATLDDVELMC